MSASKRFPGQPEDALPLDGVPPVEAVPMPVFDPEKKIAFGSVPRLLDVKLDDNYWVRPADLEHVTSDYLQNSITRRAGIQEIDGVPFDATEYATTLLNVRSYAGKVASKATVTKNRQMGNVTFRRETELKEQRTVMGRRLTEHTELFKGLDHEVKALKELRKYADKPGYALEKGGRILLLAAFGWKTFDSLLSVVGEREKWSTTDVYGAKQALLAKLKTGPQRERIGAWQSMSDDAFRYAMRRYAVVGSRQKQLETYLKEVKSGLESLYEETGFFEI